MQSIDPLGRVTARALDGLGRLIALTLPDPDGQGGLPAPVWTYRFHVFTGQVINVTAPLGRTTHYTYYYNAGNQSAQASGDVTAVESGVATCRRLPQLNTTALQVNLRKLA